MTRTTCDTCGEEIAIGDIKFKVSVSISGGRDSDLGKLVGSMGDVCRTCKDTILIYNGLTRPTDSKEIK